MTSCFTSRSISSMRSRVEFRFLALFPDRVRGLFRDDPKIGHGDRGVGLDLEPDAVFRIGRPDIGHFGPGVTGDHATSPIRATA